MTAREKGLFAYIGEGHNRWPAAHVSDVARLYRLAIEKAEPGAKYNAVAEEGVTARDIAETIGRRLKLPVKSIAPEEAEPTLAGLRISRRATCLPRARKRGKSSDGSRPGRDCSPISKR